MVELGLVIDKSGGRWHDSLKEDYHVGYKFRIIRMDTREAVYKSFEDHWDSKQDAVYYGNEELRLMRKDLTNGDVLTNPKYLDRIEELRGYLGDEGRAWAQASLNDFNQFMNDRPTLNIGQLVCHDVDGYLSNASVIWKDDDYSHYMHIRFNGRGDTNVVIITNGNTNVGGSYKIDVIDDLIGDHNLTNFIYSNMRAKDSERLAERLNS